jgi:hypothetical protein
MLHSSESSHIPDSVPEDGGNKKNTSELTEIESSLIAQAIREAGI